MRNTNIIRFGLIVAFLLIIAINRVDGAADGKLFDPCDDGTHGTNSTKSIDVEFGYELEIRNCCNLDEVLPKLETLMVRKVTHKINENIFMPDIPVIGINVKPSDVTVSECTPELDPSYKCYNIIGKLTVYTDEYTNLDNVDQIALIQDIVAIIRDAAANNEINHAYEDCVKRVDVMPFTSSPTPSPTVAAADINTGMWGESTDNAITVDFYYEMETKPSVTDINQVVPSLEIEMVNTVIKGATDGTLSLGDTTIEGISVSPPDTQVSSLCGTIETPGNGCDVMKGVLTIYTAEESTETEDLIADVIAAIEMDEDEYVTDKIDRVTIIDLESGGPPSQGGPSYIDDGDGLYGRETDTSISVPFHYAVETKEGANITELIPELEKNITNSIIPEFIDGTISAEDVTIVGISVDPEDQITSETCEAETEGNTCTVISGDITLYAEEDADSVGDTEDLITDVIDHIEETANDGGYNTNDDIDRVEVIDLGGTTVHCPASTPTDGSDTPPAETESVIIDYVYRVETTEITDDENVGQTVEYVQELIMNNIERLIAESVAENDCPATRRQLLRQLQHQRRRLELATVNSLPSDKVSDRSCSPTMTGSATCTEYEGSMTVFFTPEGENATPETVTESVLTTIEDDMTNDVYLNDVNAILVRETQPNTVKVTTIDFITEDSNRDVIAGANVEQAPVEDDGLSAWAIALIVIFIILLLLLLLLCCWCLTKKDDDDEEGKKDDLERATVCSYDGAADRSIDTNMSSDEGSYLTTDINDLGRHHSKLDVHRCTSTMCLACNPPVGKSKDANEVLKSKLQSVNEQEALETTSQTSRSSSELDSMIKKSNSQEDEQGYRLGVFSSSNNQQPSSSSGGTPPSPSRIQLIDDGVQFVPTDGANMDTNVLKMLEEEKRERNKNSHNVGFSSSLGGRNESSSLWL